MDSFVQDEYFSVFVCSESVQSDLHITMTS